MLAEGPPIAKPPEIDRIIAAAVSERNGAPGGDKEVGFLKMLSDAPA